MIEPFDAHAGFSGAKRGHLRVPTVEEMLGHMERLSIARALVRTDFEEMDRNVPLSNREWVPGRQVWMPGFMAHTSPWGSHTMSRFTARHVRPTRIPWNWGEPCVGSNCSIAAASMLLMEGNRDEDLMSQGALSRVTPYRPGVPFPPTSAGGPRGTEPVVPGSVD